jgi:hypothetical protein
MERPVLPASTPTKHNSFIYGSTLLPTLRSAVGASAELGLTGVSAIDVNSTNATGTGQEELKTLHNQISKMVKKLPFAARESVEVILI